MKDTLAILLIAKYCGDMDSRQQLVNEIEAFLAKHEMGAPEFGRLAMNDVAFVYRLRQGRDVRASTADRAREFMRDFRPLDRPRAKFIERPRSVA